eukprot:890867-Alexandrium_andersonii.AAC.1
MQFAAHLDVRSAFASRLLLRAGRQPPLDHRARALAVERLPAATLIAAYGRVLGAQDPREP